MEPLRLVGVNRRLMSQGSRATSTPQMSNSPNISLSLSISSIAQDVTPMEVDEEEDSNMAMETSVDEYDFRNSSSVTTTSSMGRIQVKEIKWVGYWSSLKPNNKESLYFKITTRPVDIELVVSGLFETYSREPEEAVMAILQFFVDLCGYRKLQISKLYKFTKGNSAEVIKLMESDLLDSDLKRTGKFIFMKASVFQTKIELILEHFFKHLLTLGSSTGFIHDGIFLGHLLEFINCMSFSLITAIRVTGVILALKCLTAFVNLYNRCNTAAEVDENSNAILKDINCRYKNMENCMEFLYIIYKKNCLLRCPKCYMIKVLCVQELLEWIKIQPDVFILERGCLGALVKLVSDKHKIVRLKTLGTWEKLIKSDAGHVHDVLQNRIEVCLKIVSTRIVDVNYKVAIKAITIFTEAIPRYFNYILREYRVLIFRKIYYKDFSLATAAANFFVNYVRKQSETVHEFLMIVSNIALSKVEYAERIQFFIEACIQFTDEFKKWDIFIGGILLSGDIKLTSKQKVLEFMKESMRRVLTGKCSYTRQILQKDFSEDPQQHVTAALSFVPNFQSLMLMFQNDKKSINSLIEVLTFINYEHCRSKNFDKCYIEILTILKEILEITVDKQLLTNICQALFCFSRSPICSRTDIIFTQIKTTYVASLNEDLHRLEAHEEDKDTLNRLKEKSLKSSILFSKFNLTDTLKWEYIFESWTDQYLQVFKYCIVCCKWYLIWKLRHLLEHSENNVDFMFHNYKEFAYSCLEILKNANNTPEFFLIFETFCDFYNLIGAVLKRKHQIDKFLVKITEPEPIEYLFNFLTKYVIESPQLPLSQRQEYVANVVNVIVLEAIPLEYFSKILRFYHTHYLEFGNIMDSILIQLHLINPALSTLILHTLTEIYDEILKKRQVVNVASEEAKQLKLLAKKFADVKVLKSGNNLLKLMTMCINHSFRTKENYAFLYFARYFVSGLKADTKQEVYDLFKKSVPDKDKNNEFILLFATSLKPKV